MNMEKEQELSQDWTLSIQECIQKKYLQTLERIHQAAIKAGRNATEIKIVVATKTHSVEKIGAVINAGARHIGENYAEEAVPKIEALSGRDISWHMIGHVQSRKAALVSTYFDYLHSLDSLKLAKRLNRFCEERGRFLPYLFECNVSGEASKAGFSAWDERQWEGFLPIFEEILGMKHLKCQGLMTITPFFKDPEKSRPYFQKLRRLRSFLQKQFRSASWDELSMGMSGDFEVAIQEGATWVRIGTAIMGERLKK